MDEYRLTGSRIERAAQALRIARQQLAAADTCDSSAAEDALSSADDAIGDAIYRIDDALDAIQTQRTEREGVAPDGAWYPRYANAA